MKYGTAVSISNPLFSFSLSITSSGTFLFTLHKARALEWLNITGDYDGIYYTIKGMEDVSTYPNLLIELVSRGWTEEEIRKICSENFLRVFEEIEKVSAQLKLETQPSLMNLSETN